MIVKEVKIQKEFIITYEKVRAKTNSDIKYKESDNIKLTVRDRSKKGYITWNIQGIIIEILETSLMIMDSHNDFIEEICFDDIVEVYR